MCILSCNLFHFTPAHRSTGATFLSFKLIKPITLNLKGTSKNKYLNTFRALTLSLFCNFTLDRQAAYLNKQINYSQV